jgi:hypothetical protein
MKGKRRRKEKGKDRKGRMEEGKGVERKKASSSYLLGSPSGIYSSYLLGSPSDL